MEQGSRGEGPARSAHSTAERERESRRSSRSPAAPPVHLWALLRRLRQAPLAALVHHRLRRQLNQQDSHAIDVGGKRAPRAQHLLRGCRQAGRQAGRRQAQVGQEKGWAKAGPPLHPVGPVEGTAKSKGLLAAHRTASQARSQQCSSTPAVQQQYSSSTCVSDGEARCGARAEHDPRSSQVNDVGTLPRTQQHVAATPRMAGQGDSGGRTVRGGRHADAAGAQVAGA